MRSVLLLAATALLALGVAPVAAGPEGGTVVGGAATIQGQGGPSAIINQTTPSAIINWNTFNIGVGESVRFNQPSSSSVALNRVTGGLGPSPDSRHAHRQRPHLPRQPRRNPVRPGRSDQHRRLPR